MNDRGSATTIRIPSLGPRGHHVALVVAVVSAVALRDSHRFRTRGRAQSQLFLMPVRVPS